MMFFFSLVKAALVPTHPQVGSPRQWEFFGERGEGARG